MGNMGEFLNQYDAYGTVAKGNSFNFVKYEEKIPDYVGKSIFLDSYNSLEKAKKEVKNLIEEGQINEGLVVDVNMNRIVWRTREI
jgi:hypothetical protein